MSIYAIGGGNHMMPPPPPDPPSYKVQPGDTLESIAQSQHTTVQALAQLNNLDLEHPHAVVISPGQQLQLPQPAADANQPAADPVTQALNNYEQVANATRNAQIMARHTGDDPSDPAFKLDLDQAQTKLNQALEFQAAANQRAGQPSDPNEINTLVQHYGGLSQFTSNQFAQSGLSNAAGTLNAPQAAAVDKIFSAVSAPTANDSNLGTRETQFANALAGQPQDVIDAVRNDPRYQPLLNEFVNVAVGNSATTVPTNGYPTQVTAWENQAQINLSDLADLMDGQTGTTNGLPPSIAADIVKMPQAQALISSVLGFYPSDTGSSTPGTPSVEAFEASLGGNFQSMSRIADSLGTNTDAANQFTQQTALQITSALQTAGVPPSAYSSSFYLNIGGNLGAPPTGMGTQASPALAIAVAQQVQASGDSKDAQGIINDISSAVNNVATSNSSYTTSVTKALSDYQSKTADLNWLVANLGAGASPQQINTAVQDYINRQGSTWQNDYNQDKATLQNSGQFLANDITQLENLPPGLKTSQVDSTLKSLAGNTSVQQALGYALQNKPLSVLGKDGSQANALVKFFQLDKNSVSLATGVAQCYMQTQLQPKLLSNLSNLTPGTPEYTNALQSTLKDFEQQNPAVASLAGLNDKNISSLSTLFDGETPNEDPQTAINTVTGKLKGFAGSQPILKSLSLVIAANGLFKTLKTTVSDPSAGNIFSACTGALGFTQNAASVAKLFSNVNPQNPFVAFGTGKNAAGELASKLLNAVGIVTNLQSLGADIDGGNTLGTVSTSMSLGATALKSDTMKSALIQLSGETLTEDGVATFLDPMAGALMWGTTLISVGEMIFTGAARPPSFTDQQDFLKDLGYGGLSQQALFTLLPQTSINPNQGTPGSSPLMLLTKYAQDKGYNLQDANQRNAFVNWVNQLAATPDGNNYQHNVLETGQVPSQLDSLVQNLDAELDYTKGDVSNFGKTSSSDQNFTQVMNQPGRMDDLIPTFGPDGVVDQSYDNDHLATYNSHMGENVIAPQSAYQIDQLLNIIQANGLPPAPASATS